LFGRPSLPPKTPVRGGGVCRFASSPRHPPRFVSSIEQLDASLRNAKLLLCPHCKHSGTLIGHGFLRGYAEQGSERVIRGRRLFCSDRFLRPGCGRTVAILLDCVMPRFSVRTTMLFDFAKAVIQGGSRRAAWLSAAANALSLSSGYRLWGRLLGAQCYLRTKLTLLCSPPASVTSEPMAQLLEHFASALRACRCPFEQFQTQLQSALLP